MVTHSRHSDSEKESIKKAVFFNFVLFAPSPIPECLAQATINYSFKASLPPQLISPPVIGPFTSEQEKMSPWL